MEMIKLVTAFLLMASPAAAQCYQAEQALEDMTASGFHITFVDTSGEVPVFLAENGKGEWVMFALQGEALCPFAGGQYGVRYPLPPNA